MAGHNFWEIRRGVRAKLAFVGRGALHDISLSKAHFSIPHPPPDNYCTVPWFSHKISAEKKHHHFTPFFSGEKTRHRKQLYTNNGLVMRIKV